MNKKIKIGILVLFCILLISIVLFLIFNNQFKEDINQGGNKDMKIKLYINNHELTATLNNNSSSLALIEKLKKGSITINMSDYANMEKVGNLGVELPRNDEYITTSAGDLILYQGNNFVIYYDTNHWSLTRLGRIDNINTKELKDILGNGDVTIKLSLN